METTLPLFKPDAAQTLAFAAFVLLLGFLLKRRIRIVDRLNIPAPVVGGLVIAVLILLFRKTELAAFEFDNSVRPILELAFFTTIGMGASAGLLRKGGIQVAIFLALSSFLCLAQNFLGMAIARAFGIHPLIGVMAGSVTLVGGPATGAAFAKEFEALGVIAADSLAIAAATFGIVCGGLLGGPVGTWLIEKKVGRNFSTEAAGGADPSAEGSDSGITIEADREDTPLLRNLMTLCMAMGAGVVVSGFLKGLSFTLYDREIKFTLPAYIGAMIVAAVLRNYDDFSGRLRISPSLMDLIGSLSLLVYLAITLLRLELWKIAHLAVPLVVILAAQVALMAVFAIAVSFRVMGRDYEAGVMSAGLVGFALGTTANALTNMRALVSRYGPAPRSFLVVPLVGAGMIDFVNSIFVTIFMNTVGR